MLDEYVLVPDIFDQAAYSNPAFIEMCLPHLREPLMQEALVRDLADGGWSRYCKGNSERLHRLCMEFVKKLAQGNRLRKLPQAGAAAPTCAKDWCAEGISSSAMHALKGIVAAQATKDDAAFKANLEVASIERLTATPWWQSRSATKNVDRKTADYLRVLERVLAQANSFMFIDPYLDPSSPGYREFHRLLTPLAQRNPRPKIELHRSFNKGLAQGVAATEQLWKQNFAVLGQQLYVQNLSAEVFIWSEFHDRHLITDVIGISASAGFDVTNRPNELTTWARHGRESKDSIQRQFDSASRPIFRFNIGTT
jgi:hypothetical protein